MKKKPAFDHKAVGQELSIVRSNLMNLTGPIQKSYGKNSSAMRGLTKTIEALDHLRIVLENHLAGECTQYEWDKQKLFLVYRGPDKNPH